MVAVQSYLGVVVLVVVLVGVRKLAEGVISDISRYFEKAWPGTSMGGNLVMI